MSNPRLARTRGSLLVLALALSAASLAGCAAAAAAPVDTIARPAAFAELPSVELLGPDATHVGGTPEFSWRPVEGAEVYRLSVVGADGPVWAWEGAATDVLFGGHAALPDPAAGVQRLRAAAWWSVSAYAADGTLLAVSELRAVSPDASAPTALGQPASFADEPEPAAEPAAIESACELFSDDEAAGFLEGALAGPGEGGIHADGQTLYCSWVRADDEFLTLDLSVRPGASRESWDESMDAMLEFHPDLPRGFTGLGDDSYLSTGWSGTRVALIDDDVYVSVSSGFTGGAEEATVALAGDLLARYLERAR